MLEDVFVSGVGQTPIADEDSESAGRRIPPASADSAFTTVAAPTASAWRCQEPPLINTPMETALDVGELVGLDIAAHIAGTCEYSNIARELLLDVE